MLTQKTRRTRARRKAARSPKKARGPRSRGEGDGRTGPREGRGAGGGCRRVRGRRRPRRRAAKKERKERPIRHLQRAASFNNTVISISDQAGNVLSGRPAGCIGFRARARARRSRRSWRPGRGQHRQGARRQADRGPGHWAGAGRESSIRALQAIGLEVKAIKDVTPIPHNGCRPPNAGASERREKSGEDTWFGLPALPSRGAEAVPEGDALLHGEVRHRAAHFAPGQHGKRRVKLQGYGVQLREKQKVKRLYGLLGESVPASDSRRPAQEGDHRERLLHQPGARLGQRRLPSRIASSRPRPADRGPRPRAVDGRKVDIPAFLVKAGAGRVAPPKMEKNEGFLARSSRRARAGSRSGSWWTRAASRGPCRRCPRAEDITIPSQNSRIVAFDSK